MPVEGTEKALTVDADVINFYLMSKKKDPLPQGIRITRLEEFGEFILEKYTIAINKYILDEYIVTSGLKAIQKWMLQRRKDGLDEIEVSPIRLKPHVIRCLSDKYRFRCRSKDMKYLETCKNTIFKKLITNNTDDFCKTYYRNPRKLRMDKYLEIEESICIHTVNECCCALLDN